ncbi:FRIGIDA-like protein 4a [Camellia lanceoleosa]|uniref:FRIGIDA-like protein 4a n=1 Tax=Camellia lanceoleosa TaxID=1840588 RepID=A0ACC0HNL7_9ERIC|nr:FRIGIDA-like protein 4a [Camellia lanceoleosa]
MMISDIEKVESRGKERSLLEVLRICCQMMDLKGFVRFLLAKRKELVVLKVEIAAKVEESVDAMRLVLDTMEEFVEIKVGMVIDGDSGGWRWRWGWAGKVDCRQ